ncbi:glycine receptor subunit alpha-2-like isoform X2 [Tachypleus tridentatus]|uniref:glycine receptor subunit alpha-2-like isoform X2 n=1 Tax=Tachypleus tridentatus TaxID=6853 RepID=UPI003FD4D51C
MRSCSDDLYEICKEFIRVSVHIHRCGSDENTHNKNSRSIHIDRHPEEMHHLSFIDKVLFGYDKRAWPTYGIDKPTTIKVNIYINSLSSVSAANMDYGLDIYFRQSWQDHRLHLADYGLNKTVTLNAQELINRIWKPDLFFINVKEAHFHLVTVPNMLIKISPEGDILYSVRLTLRLTCEMVFHDYPLDTQHCHVLMSPYALNDQRIILKWTNKPIQLNPKLKVPEYDIVNTFQIGSSHTHYGGIGNFSVLKITFTLKRQNGYHLIETYLPTFMIVMISWVSFWLNVDAVPARVTLGVTTLLTLTTVAAGVRTNLPPVSYVKAIDVWIGACSVMVFGALLEFTLVNFLSRSKFRSDDILKTIKVFRSTGPKTIQDNLNVQMRPTKEMARNVKKARHVDRVCRVLFPFVFFVFNIIYWFYYVLLEIK